MKQTRFQISSCLVPAADADTFNGRNPEPVQHSYSGTEGTANWAESEMKGSTRVGTSLSRLRSNEASERGTSCLL